MQYLDSEKFTNNHLSYCSWFRSRWFFVALTGVIFLAILIGFITQAPISYIFGQLVLGTSVYFSLFLLANKPLINPIQAVVIIFYWWIGVGPVVIATWNYLVGMPDIALDAQVSGMEALWILAPGLIIYAITARLTFLWFSRKGIYARFLQPTENNYHSKVLIIYLSLISFSMIARIVLQHLGIQGQEEMSFLGGTKTNIWWVGVIAAIGLMMPFITSACMFELATPWKMIPFVVRVLIVIVIVQTIMAALYGGWKSPIAIMGAYFICAYVSRRQRPPWVILIAGALIFIGLIAPFVGYGREKAINSGSMDSAARMQVFSDTLKDPQSFLPNSTKDLDPGLIFRGISPLASELTRRNSLFDGEWHGDTITWGIELLIPRVFMQDKRYADIGNFFCRTVGVDTGVCNRNETFNSLAISIPFEFVGNYGWFAGILSFGFIGFFWTIFCVWMLSSNRLSDHPLTPYLVVLTMQMELPFGSFLGIFRDISIPLLLCFFVYKILRGQI